MLYIPGYKFKETIHQGKRSLISHYVREADNSPVIVKTQSNESQSAADLDRLQRDYEFGRRFNHPGINSYLALESLPGGVALIKAGTGSVCLADYIPETGMGTEAFLSYALQLTEGLVAIHQQDIVHKDLQPDNIILDPQDQSVKIIDFGISTLLSESAGKISEIDFPQGNLAYIAPEQVGRMSRSVDFRSDLYSLGATFYKLLTGQVPFSATDPLELCHAHITKQPVSPSDVRETIPLQVSNIVMKLLAKNPEDRYQTSLGLQADLKKCLNQIKSKGEIRSFPVGEKDVAETLNFPHRLYGRHSEIDLLHSYLEGSLHEQIRIVTVSGELGLGKTALVNTLRETAFRQRFYFAGGQIEKSQNHTPFSAITMVLENLVHQFLIESEENINRWKTDLNRVLGSQGQIMVTLIPSLEKVVGQLPEVPVLPPMENRNRFHHIFKQFIRTLKRPGSPLILFFDNLMWADADSLNLIRELVSEPELKFVLILGAYRDHEVGEHQPLRFFLNRIGKISSFRSLHLEHLSRDALTEFLSDCLYLNPIDATPLAELIGKKTNGNPFFVREFLTGLVDQKILKLDPARRKWLWDLEKVQEQPASENIVNHLINQNRQLDKRSQHGLSLAACIGQTFDLRILATIWDKSLNEAADSIQPAIEAGMIYGRNFDLIPRPINHWLRQLELDSSESIELKFADKHIFQYAYDNLPDAERKQNHLRIGRLLLADVPENQLAENRFDLLFQIDNSKDLITDSNEQSRVAEQYLKAGITSLQLGAYDISYQHTKSGIEMLGQTPWQSQFQLSLDLYNTAAEASLLAGNHDLMETHVQVILQNTDLVQEQITAYQCRIRSFTSQANYQAAIETGLKVLKPLGISLKLNPSRLSVFKSRIINRLRFYHRDLHALKNLPKMTDFRILTAMSILESLTTAAYWTSQPLLSLNVSLRIEMTLKYGIAPESASAFIGYGSYLISTGNIDRAVAFGKLGFEIQERFRSKLYYSKIVSSYHRFIAHWKAHTLSFLPLLMAGYRAGLETGDSFFAIDNLIQYISHKIHYRADLAAYHDELIAFRDLVYTSNQPFDIELYNMFLQINACEAGNTNNPRLFSGEYYDGETLLVKYQTENNLPMVLIITLFKYNLEQIFGEPGLALRYAETCKQLETVLAPGAYTRVEVNVNHSLALLTDLHRNPVSDPRRKLQQVINNQKILQRWADHCPQNYAHWYLLVEAESQSFIGRGQQALDKYQAAIDTSQQHGHLLWQAGASYLAVEHCLRNGMETVAKAYLWEAFLIFERIGAKARSEILIKKFPLWFDQWSTDYTIFRNSTSLNPPDSLPDQKAATSWPIGSEPLDLITIIKASQTISGEIERDKLIQRMMEIIIQNAGAEKGYLVRPVDNSLKIVAGITPDSIWVKTHASPPLDSDQMCASIVRYVFRTKDNVVLNHASVEGEFTQDPYIQKNQIQSILCTPIRSQDQTTGILYLENNLTSQAFSETRIRMLQILLSQAAISLENADLFEQKTETENALIQSEDRFRQMIELAPYPIVIMGPSRQIKYGNQQCIDIFGYSLEDAVSMKQLWERVFPDSVHRKETLAILNRAISSVETSPGDFGSIEREIACKDGSIKSVEFRMVQIGESTMFIMNDLTERKRTQELMIQTEKMVSVGGLAAGMAHEINNPLGGILQGTQNILRRLSPEFEKNTGIAQEYGIDLERLNQYLEDRNIIKFLHGIRNSGERAARIISNMLQFSRRSESELVPSDLAQLIDQAVEIAGNDYDLENEFDFKKISISKAYDKQMPPVPCIETEIEQVILNLLKNSAQAMAENPASTKPTIKIITTFVEGKARIEIIDNGPGIDFEIQKRVFEPFFTTKVVGKGTGLGLSVSYMIITSNHKGSMEVLSNAGQGTHFVIHLPVPHT